MSSTSESRNLGFIDESGIRPSTSLRSATSPELIELEKREGNCHPD